MALVTIQRSPTPSTDPDLDFVDSSEDTSDGRSQLRKRSKTSKEKLKKIFSSVRFISKLRPCLSESYFTVKGAALILPHTECTKKSTKKSHGGEIQNHLQAMLHLLRPEDTIKIAVRLEDTSHYQCYMALVSTRGRQDTEEAVILGIDCTSSTASIGLVLPMWMGLKIKLGGDGGFSLCTDEQSHLFKPVSVQAMWSAIQSLYKVLRIAEDMKYISEGLTHTWIGYYRSRIDNRDSVRMCQWNVEGVEVFAPSSLSVKANDSDNERIKLTISQTLKEVMMTFDLDEATSVMLRNAAEQKMGISLSAYKSYFDEEVMRIVGQMDKPSKILDFLYLGSEWNASNLEELIEKGIGYILNVTKEIDNFFEGRFQYYNVRVYDVDESDLLRHWDKTYKFISKARNHDSKVLVHCKMGVSRSASTVMAFIMKDQRMTVDEAYQFVKEQRNCVHPNAGFMEQLRTYEGILTASNKRDIFRSKSEQNLMDEGSREEAEPSQGYFLGDSLFHMMSHPDWQPAAEFVACQEECIGSLHKDEMYNLDFLPVDTELEAAESRSADSTKEVLCDFPCQTPEVIIALQAPSASMTTSPVPIIRPSGGAPYSIRDVVLERESSAELESYTALSSSEGSSSLQFRASIGFLGPRIKADSSWIKLDTGELQEGDINMDNLLFIDALPLDQFCSQPSIPAVATPKSSGTIIPRCELETSKACTDGEPKVVPLGAAVPGFLPATSPPHSTSLSPEKTGSFNPGVHFYIGNNQIAPDIKPALPVTALSMTTPHFLSPMSTKFSYGQTKSSDSSAFPGDHLTETQSVDVKQTAVEHILQWTLANMQQKESLEKSPKCRDTIPDKEDGDTKAKIEEVTGTGVSSIRVPPSRIEPGVRQYFFREKIPWKPGKVKKMQEDINKTGQISQDEDEEDQYLKEDLTEVTGQHADANDEWTLLEQTSGHQPAITLCQSHSCVELTNSEETGAATLSLYEREEIPLTAGTVLRTRLEIEERQRLFCGEGDQELFGTTRPVLRTSSLKQERGSPRSRCTDNRRLTCGPIMSPGKSLDDLQSVGVLHEHLFSLRSPTPLSSGHIEGSSDGELANNIQTIDESHSILHKDGLKKPPVEAGLVRKHKMELESKYETDKPHIRVDMRSSSPVSVNVRLSAAPQAAQDSQNTFISMNRASKEDTENNQCDVVLPSSQSVAARLSFDSDFLIQETGSALLTSPSPPKPQDVDGNEPCANMVKYFVRKIEKQAVVSTAAHNVALSEGDARKATSPVRDESSKIMCSPVGDGINRSNAHVPLNTCTYSKTSKPSDFLISTTGSTAGCAADFSSFMKDVLSEMKQETTHVAGLEKTKLENPGSGSMDSSRKSLDLMLETHTPLAAQVSKQTLENMKNISLCSPGSRVKEQVAALAETARSDPASSPRTSSHISDPESPEPFVVKHLVGLFENKSPESDRVSSNSSHDLILKLKDLQDISISSPSASSNTQTDDQATSLSFLEDTSKPTVSTVSQSYFKPMDDFSTHACTSSMTSTCAKTSSSVCSSVSPISSPPFSSLHRQHACTSSVTSPGAMTSSSVCSSVSPITSPSISSLHRQHASLDSDQFQSCASRKTPFTSDISVEVHELPSDPDGSSMGENSPVSPSSSSARKLGPVPFNRSVMESSEKKGWRSVRPKSADHIHRCSSCSDSKCSSTDTLQQSDVISKYSSFPTVESDSACSSSDTLQRSDVISKYSSFPTVVRDDDASLRQVSEEGRKIRRLHGKSHPLSKLSEHCLGTGPFYSSM